MCACERVKVDSPHLWRERALLELLLLLLLQVGLSPGLFSFLQDLGSTQGDTGLLGVRNQPLVVAGLDAREAGYGKSQTEEGDSGFLLEKNNSRLLPTLKNSVKCIRVCVSVHD